MKIKNKLLAGILSAAMVLTAFTGTALADDSSSDTTYSAGTYTSEIHMYKSSDSTTASMCDSIFCHTADVTLTDDNLVITFYVAYPIPAYPSEGTDGTLTSVKATYNETDYTADLDVTTKATKTFDTTGSLFGITAGDELPTEAITLTLPASAVSAFLGTDEDGTGLYITAYVNAVMNTTQYFYLRGSDLTAVVAEATKTVTSSTEVTATVEKNAPTYTVTVPSTVALGTLDKENDNVQSYDVTVETADFDGDSISVVAEASGSLSDGTNTLAFTNDFGTQTATESTTLQGNITIRAAAAKAAVAGNYTGTTTFTINYYAAE